MPAYHEAFQAGELLSIADEAALRAFQQYWTNHHHPLQEAQIPYAGARCFVRHVGFYHGGECLYEVGMWGPDLPATLEIPYIQSQDLPLPGLWHEACLKDFHVDTWEAQLPLASEVYTVRAETRQGQQVIVVQTHTGIECLIARQPENEMQAVRMNAVAALRNARAFERRYAFKGVIEEASRARYNPRCAS